MQGLKSKTVIIIFIILVILASILSLQQRNDRVSNLYQNIKKRNEYSFSMKELNSEMNYSMSVIKKNDDMLIDMKTDEDHTSTLVLKENAYVIMHNDKTYYEYESEEIDGDIISAGLEETKQKKYISGIEKINDKKYYYEEFEDVVSFLILLNANEESTVKTRFYFDGENIEYIKNILYSEDGSVEEEILETKLEFNVNSDDFKIPDGYIKM